MNGMLEPKVLVLDEVGCPLLSIHLITRILNIEGTEIHTWVDKVTPSRWWFRKFGDLKVLVDTARLALG